MRAMGGWAFAGLLLAGCATHRDWSYQSAERVVVGRVEMQGEVLGLFYSNFEYRSAAILYPTNPPGEPITFLDFHEACRSDDESALYLVFLNRERAGYFYDPDSPRIDAYWQAIACTQIDADTSGGLVSQWPWPWP